MLESYVTAPKTVKRLRSRLSGPYIDGFVAALERDGYSQASTIRYLRAAAHLGHFLQKQAKLCATLIQPPPRPSSVIYRRAVVKYQAAAEEIIIPILEQSVTVSTCCKLAFVMAI
jgi:hypothetical protein